MESQSEFEIFLEMESRSQSFDLALVLFSQGIENTPDYDEEGLRWGVWVNTAHEHQSLELQKYVIKESTERKIPNTQSVASWPPLTIFGNGIILSWCLVLIFIFIWGPESNSPIKSAGILNSSVLDSGEYFRLITSICLHGDLEHLILNITFGLIFTSLACWRLGTGRGLLASLLAGTIANFTYCWLKLESNVSWSSLGASGFIFGSLGLLVDLRLIKELRWSDPNIAKFRSLGSLISACAIFGFFGLNPNSNWVAHLVGFGAGILLANTVIFQPSRKSTVLDIVALFTFSTTLAYSWYQAAIN